MTISGLFSQNLTITLSTSPQLLSLTLQPKPSDSLSPSVSLQEPTDTVTVSEDAVKQAATSSPEAAARTTPATITTTAEDTPATSDRADALFNALDADGDGTVSNDEFVDGSRELLRRGHRHHHHDRENDGVDGHRHGHRHGHGFGLSRRLDRLFDRIDANGDGSVDKAELTSALEGLRRPASGPDDSAGAPTSTATTTTITIVSATTTTGGNGSTPVVQSADAPKPVEGDTKGTAGNAAVTAPADDTTSEEQTDAVGNDTGTPSDPSTDTTGTTASTPGAPLSVTQITVVTIAIQQYTTYSYGDPTASSRTISAAA